MKSLVKNIGQTTIAIPLVLSFTITIVGAIVAYYTNVRATDAAIADTNQSLVLVKTTENLHYEELKDDLGTMQTDIRSIMKALRVPVSGSRLMMASTTSDEGK